MVNITSIAFFCTLRHLFNKMVPFFFFIENQHFSFTKFHHAFRSSALSNFFDALKLFPLDALPLYKKMSKLLEYEGLQHALGEP